MQTKLTLSIDQPVIEQAKAYAKEQGQSLSQLIEHYLRAVTRTERDLESGASATLKAMRGSMKEPKDFDQKRVLSEMIAANHITQ